MPDQGIGTEAGEQWSGTRPHTELVVKPSPLWEVQQPLCSNRAVRGGGSAEATLHV